MAAFNFHSLIWAAGISISMTFSLPFWTKAGVYNRKLIVFFQIKNKLKILISIFCVIKNSIFAEVMTIIVKKSSEPSWKSSNNYVVKIEIKNGNCSITVKAKSYMTIFVSLNNIYIIIKINVHFTTIFFFI